jgi:hypothetical protein
MKHGDKSQPSQITTFHPAHTTKLRNLVGPDGLQGHVAELLPIYYTPAAFRRF